MQTTFPLTQIHKRHRKVHTLFAFISDCQISNGQVSLLQKKPKTKKGHINSK